MRDANAGGTTVLLVEQNVRLGLSMATHGVVLEGGRVALEAPAGELMANPEVAELYLGGAPSKAAAAARGGRGPPAATPAPGGDRRAVPAAFAGFGAAEMARREAALEAVMERRGPRRTSSSTAPTAPAARSRG